MFRLEGQVAVVTGGAGNVGSAIARGLAESGATVIVASRNAPKCSEFAAQLTADGLRVEGERCDLAEEEEIRALRSRILERHGRIDILVNNSLTRAGGDLRNTTEAEWEASMKVNSTGLFLACQIFSETMQTERRGSIVNIGSIYGVVAPDFALYEGTRMGNRVDYSFAKAGMIGLTRYLAMYLAPHGVRVNCIVLGGVESPGLPEDLAREFTRRVPLGRMAQPADIAGPAVFLASEGSRYITGQSIAVDGGWTIV